MTSPVIQADSSDARNTASGCDISDATEPAERRLPGQNGAGTTLKGPRGYIFARGLARNTAASGMKASGTPENTR